MQRGGEYEMDYVIRNKNTYIKLDTNGTPTTCSKHEARRFEYSKARNVIEMLPKTLRKFHFKLEAVPEITPLEKEGSKPKDNKPKKVIQEPKDIPDTVMRWVTKVESLNGLAQEASDRIKTLEEEYIHIERKELDVLHEIELSRKVNACDGYKKFRELKEILEKRREIKDEKLVVSILLESNIGQLAAVDFRRRVDGLKTRTYAYREQD